MKKHFLHIQTAFCQKLPDYVFSINIVSKIKFLMSDYILSDESSHSLHCALLLNIYFQLKEYAVKSC